MLTWTQRNVFRLLAAGLGLSLTALWWQTMAGHDIRSATAGPAEERTEAAADELPPLPDGLTAGASRAKRDAWLKDRVEALVAAMPHMSEARIGVAVHDHDSGRVVLAREAKGLSHVASNVKILTTSAVLAGLGPGFRYRTSVLAEGIDAAGQVTGDLYLRGGGDPTLDADNLDYLAKELTLAGITGVQGDIVVDDSYFDGLITPPHFDDFSDPVDRHARYRAPMGALTIERGTFQVVIAPARSGQGPARVLIDPPSDYVRVTADEMLTQASGRPRLDVKAKQVDEHMTLTVRGQIRAGAKPTRFRLRVEDPALYAGAVMKEVLGRRGVRVRGSVQRGAVPAGATVLSSASSAPLALLVRQLGKRSNNAVAESLLLTLGAETVAVPANRPATWEDGLSALRQHLITDIGLSAAKGAFSVANGSGLYGPTRISPTQLAKVLRKALRDPRYGPDFKASLAIAGVDGTLRRRMKRGRALGLVRGKTGTLGSVSALSGHAALTAGGPALVFSIIASDLPRDGAVKKRARRNARKLQNQIAEALIAYLQAAAPRR